MITKQAIVDAAMRLAEKKDIEKVTVTDIVKECHIARQTFYYHFQDVIDVMEWGAQQEQDRAQKQAQSCTTAEEALMLYINILMERRGIFVKILNSRYNLQVMKVMTEGIRSYIKILGELKKDQIDQPVKDALFLADYHAGAITMLLARWMLEKDVDMEAQVHQIVRVMGGDLCLPKLIER